MIYLDYVATTPLDEEIRSTYTKLLTTYFANSDSTYAPGYEVSRLIEQSRAHIAKLLHVSPDELIFYIMCIRIQQYKQLKEQLSNI